MQEIIKLAKALHINLVPEIDTPGHALSFVKVRPDLMYKGQLSARKHNVERVAMLDLDNKYEETLAFVKSVYDKLLDGPDAPLMAFLPFISVQMSIMEVQKVIVAMLMTSSSISKEKVIHHVFGDHSAPNKEKRQLIGKM